MNRSALKNFAAGARRDLVRIVSMNVVRLGIDAECGSVCVDENHQSVNLRSICDKKESIKDIIGDAAYKWFIRFTALRFMEINGFIKTKTIEMFSKAVKNDNLTSEIVSMLMSNSSVSGKNIRLQFGSTDYFEIDKDKVNEMSSQNDMNGLFKYIIKRECNALNKIMPFMFEGEDDCTEMLFPDGILNRNSFICGFTDNDVICDEDWRSVEIVGWLYQYYMSGIRNGIVQSKKRYEKDEIPAATQLFTPGWIAKYMVQNTLGRLWIESHPEQSNLKSNWQFYFECNDNHTKKTCLNLNVQDIKCFDPACGAGHVLVCMFDVLYEIYTACGYKKSDIPRLIIENNIYGLDIDDRAYGLSCFAVLMRGMKYNGMLLEDIKQNGIKLNIASIQETNGLDDSSTALMAGENSGENFNKMKNFVEQFKDAKMYGSLIKIQKYDREFINGRLKVLKGSPSFEKYFNLLSKLLNQADIMSETYDILVTNPPYIYSKHLNPVFLKFISENYSDAKSDLFAAFMLYGFSKVKSYGHIGFMTPFVWMFIKSYKALRKIILENKSITSLIQLEYSGFGGAIVPICTFTLRNCSMGTYGNFIKLSDFKGIENQPVKVKEAAKDKNADYRYIINQDKIKNIPGMRFGFWLSGNEIDVLNSAKSIGDISYPCTGMQTGNNKKYIREWFEVDYDLLNLKCEDTKTKYWMPYQMGGEARKWYGNISEVLYWKNNGEKIKRDRSSVIRNEKYYFRKGISWKRITSGSNTIRVLNRGFIFDQSADSIFVKDDNDYKCILSFLNTKVMMYIFKFIAPTMNLTAGTVKEIPIYIEKDKAVREKIDSLCGECIDISRNDWDSYETSWNFKTHPFIAFKKDSNYIGDAFLNWKQFKECEFERLKADEEELNRIFIKMYGFKEITPDVQDRDITIRKADRKRDIVSFISYAVGCIFGRYSLNAFSIEYAGGAFEGKWRNENGKWKVKSRDNWVDSDFSPVKDNIIPVTPRKCFKEDIVSRFIEFVSAVFGCESLKKNIDYIAETLEKKDGETSEDAIRRYFVNDFYKDHVKMYKHKPIYWMFTSGRRKAFNCLVYMHRFDDATLTNIRIYLNKLQHEVLIKKENLLNCRGGQKALHDKKALLIDKQIDELAKYEHLLHAAEYKHIKINLDDGVCENYSRFKGLLYDIPQRIN